MQLNIDFWVVYCARRITVHEVSTEPVLGYQTYLLAFRTALKCA